MKTTINGVTFEDVTVEEALQLLRSSQTKQKTESMTEVRVKRAYTKRKNSPKTKTKVWWTEEEIHYILANPKLTPKELSINIPRHTIMATGIMSSGLRSGKTKGIGKYIPKVINSFYNKNSEAIKIPVFAKS